MPLWEPISGPTIARLSPDFPALGAASNRCVIVTAPGDAGQADFVSRFFGPAVGIDEDPVTGSAHCALTPYWVERIGRSTLHARQLSARGGRLDCTLNGDRVVLGGLARTYMHGTVYLD